MSGSAHGRELLRAFGRCGQRVALDLARHGIQLNATAQNFVANPTFCGAEVQANPCFQERLKRDVPLGRLVSAEEVARFAA